MLFFLTKYNFLKIQVLLYICDSENVRLVKLLICRRLSWTTHVVVEADAHLHRITARITQEVCYLGAYTQAITQNIAWTWCDACVLTLVIATEKPRSAIVRFVTREFSRVVHTHSANVRAVKSPRDLFYTQLILN